VELIATSRDTLYLVDTNILSAGAPTKSVLTVERIDWTAHGDEPGGEGYEHSRQAEPERCRDPGAP